MNLLTVEVPVTVANKPGTQFTRPPTLCCYAVTVHDHTRVITNTPHPTVTHVTSQHTHTTAAHHGTSTEPAITQPQTSKVTQPANRKVRQISYTVGYYKLMAKKLQ